jgi:hypothetical protein
MREGKIWEVSADGASCQVHSRPVLPQRCVLLLDQSAHVY